MSDEELLLSILEIEASIPATPEPLLEYKIGQRASAAKYLQRLGSPGHYMYIYPTLGYSKMGRHAKIIFSRLMRKGRRFFKKYQQSYDAKGFNYKPKSWYDGFMSIKKKDGGILDFHVNLKQHGIYSYRSKRGRGGVWLQLSKAKKKGVLRYQ